jgi:hypothetical protein
MNSVVFVDRPVMDVWTVSTNQINDVKSEIRNRWAHNGVGSVANSEWFSR